MDGQLVHIASRARFGLWSEAIGRCGRSVAIAPARDEMGQGRVPGADPAPAQNTGDGVATFDEVIRKMRRDAKSGTKLGVSRLARGQRTLHIAS